jgi:sugar phosphate isomerase/epimerase
MRVYGKQGMKEVFKYLEEILDETGITVCVEPNSRLYGAEYYWSMAEIVEDIVDYKNIKTMIDTGSLIMEEYDIEKNIEISSLSM